MVQSRDTEGWGLRRVLRVRYRCLRSCIWSLGLRFPILTLKSPGRFMVEITFALRTPDVQLALLATVPCQQLAVQNTS